MSYVANIEQIISDLDAGLVETDNFQETEGMVVGGNKGYLIIINSKLNPYSRRWAMAHEVGHIVDDTVNSHHSKLSEHRANKNAFHLLISDNELEKARSEYGDDWDGYSQLFGVSQETWIERCKMSGCNGSNIS